MVLTLSLATVAMAQIESSINGQWSAGYLHYDSYNEFADGAFFGQYRWYSARFTKEVKPNDQVTAGVVFQIDYYDADYGRKNSTTTVTTSDGATVDIPAPKFPSPVANFYLIYDPGFMKLTFDAKGRDVVMGIPSEEFLKLNIARRFAKDGEPHIYRCDHELAKQLTVEVPFGDLGKAVAVVGLEKLSTGAPLEFVGAFAQFNVGPGMVGVGYQPEMTDASYKHKVGEGYFVIATDFDITDSIRLQADYTSQKGNGVWRPYWVEDYRPTPFVISGHINSKLTINGIHNINARLMNTENDGLKYWIDASYKLNDTYRVGLNYRNWAFNTWGGTPQEPKAAADGYLAEIYGKYEAGPNVTVFYRTDGGYGFFVEIGFW